MASASWSRTARWPGSARPMTRAGPARTPHDRRQRLDDRARHGRLSQPSDAARRRSLDRARLRPDRQPARRRRAQRPAACARPASTGRATWVRPPAKTPPTARNAAWPSACASAGPVVGNIRMFGPPEHGWPGGQPARRIWRSRRPTATSCSPWPCASWTTAPTSSSSTSTDPTSASRRGRSARCRAVVKAAAKRGKKVTAHSGNLAGARVGVAAGVHSLEHGFELDADLCRDMAAGGTFLVSTLAVMESWLTFGRTTELPRFAQRRGSAAHRNAPRSGARKRPAGARGGRGHLHGHRLWRRLTARQPTGVGSREHSSRPASSHGRRSARRRGAAGRSWASPKPAGSTKAVRPTSC